MKDLNSVILSINDYWKRSIPIAKRYEVPTVVMVADRLWCKIRHGVVSSADYDYFGMYRLNHFERRNFFTTGRFFKSCKMFFNDEMLKKVDSKKGFSESFKDLTKRSILQLPCSEEALRSFMQNKSEIFVKENYNCGGQGIRKIATSEIIDNEKLLLEIISMDGVAEETIIQHPLMESLNPDSVSTSRIVSFIEKDGTLNIMSTALRIGKKGAFVDNTHSGGLMFEVDKDTGIVVGYGKNSEITKVVKTDSGVIVPGFQIPFWPEVLSLIEEAALRYTDARFVGWDVAIGIDGPILVEANIGTGPDGFQFGDFGCWNYLRSHK